MDEGATYNLPDVSDSENDLYDYFAQLFLKAAETIRLRNNLKEDQFQFTSRAHYGRGRSHFVYRALDEIEKLAIYLDGDRVDMFVPEQQNDVEKRVLRNILCSKEREQAVIIRQQLELLAHLICFSKTNTDAYFDHYLLYRELHQLDFYLRDTKEYFGAYSSTPTRYRNVLIKSIISAEQRLDISKCWYLKKAISGGTAKSPTFADVFRKAVTLASKFEKAAMGLSYGLCYGDQSQVLHLPFGYVRHDPSISKIISNKSMIAHLGLCCLRRISKLCGFKMRKGELADLAAIEKGLCKNSLLNKFTNPGILEGDFVIANNALCEVTKTVLTKYGYRSFQLKYLSRPPIEEIKQDWLPAHQVRKFISYKELREKALDRLTIDGVRPHIPRQNARKARDAMRKAVLSMWKLFQGDK